MTTRNCSLLVGVALAAVWLCGTPSFAAEAVVMSAAQEKAIGIRLATAVAAEATPITTVPASVAPPMNGRRIVASPFAGTVIQVNVLEGQSVKAGAALAVLFSRDALTVGSELSQARAELGVAEAAARRSRTLAAEGIIAGARVEEANARAAQARARVSERQRLISSAGGAGARPGEFILRAPISGRIAQLNIAPGAGLEAMAPALTIDRSDKLWLEARLSPDLVDRVKVGGAARVGGVTGRIIAVGSSVDPRTRSVVVRAEIAGDGRLAPGQTASLTLLGPVQPGAVQIPRSAVIQGARGAMVFVREGKGYRSAPVAVIGAAGQFAVITGLAPGARVAVSGVSQLKSALDQ